MRKTLPRLLLALLVLSSGLASCSAPVALKSEGSAYQGRSATASPSAPPDDHRESCATPPRKAFPLTVSACGLHSSKYYFDGEACILDDLPHCRCDRLLDCGTLYDTVEACEAAHAHCR